MKYQVGTMIEIPRAALTADEIAKEAEFFSFGTNDLTQMTYGFSRDDAAKFLNEYYTKNIFESDPFAHIDENGVGQLMQIAINKAKPVRPDIKLGICGEHGGDPRTVEFCHRIGLTYVSCSPYRVPLARLAAAQAAVAEGISKEAIEAVVGTEVAQAAINAEFARLINSIKTLQARTYVFNGKDKVSYTDTRTGTTSYYVIEWKAHEVVSFKVQG